MLLSCVSYFRTLVSSEREQLIDTHSCKLNLEAKTMDLRLCQMFSVCVVYFGVYVLTMADSIVQFNKER